MADTLIGNGYEPGTRPAERRAFFDLKRLLSEIKGAGGGINLKAQISGSEVLPTNPEPNDAYLVGTPVPSGLPNDPDGNPAAASDVIVWTGTEWVNMGAQAGPQGLPGPSGPAGPTGPPGPAGPLGPDTTWRGDGAPPVQVPPYDLWIDTSVDPPLLKAIDDFGYWVSIMGADEVWIGTSTPIPVTSEFWIDTDDEYPPIVLPEEVFVGPTAPATATLDLWVDTDEDYPATGGTDEVWIGADTPTTSSLELWIDTDEDYAGGAEEVWIGPTAPTGPYELWVDTSS